MAKLEKQYPSFECIEYDYGQLSNRDYNGPIYAVLKFADNIDMHVYFYFKDFLDFHKRKKSPLHKAVERLLTEINGWGSRHFLLIERLQTEEGLDLFQLFAEFIEFIEEDLGEQYHSRRHRIEEMRRSNSSSAHERQNKEAEQYKGTPPIIEDEDFIEDDFIDDDFDEDDFGEDDFIEDDTKYEEVKDKDVRDEDTGDDDDDDNESPYNNDRKKLQELLEQSSNDMYEALKINFFPQMPYFQRRYPSRWKVLTENLEEILQNFENQLLDALLPRLNDDEFREFDIKYNSQKADMSDEEEPPTAR